MTSGYPIKLNKRITLKFRFSSKELKSPHLFKGAQYFCVVRPFFFTFLSLRKQKAYTNLIFTNQNNVNYVLVFSLSKQQRKKNILDEDIGNPLKVRCFL